MHSSIPLEHEARNQDCDSRRRLRIAYVTMRDSNDRRAWSGTLYNMGRALEQHCGDVVRIGPLQPFSMKVGKLVSHGVRRLTGRNYLYTHTMSLSKKLGKLVEERLAAMDLDVIFAPAASTIIAHLRTNLPIVYLSDATVKLLLGYYDEFTGVLPSHVRIADSIEQMAIRKAARLVYPSAWAADSAVRDYGASQSHVHVVPFGANTEEPPCREEAVRPHPQDCCQLLFVGVEWRRKGGEIAFETLLGLERLGIIANLTVIGCTPPSHVRHPRLRVFPFLNKNIESQRAQLDELYREADFFVLPTRAECFSIALCEANAFGIPVLSTQTGGLPELVEEGVNGFLFPLDARGDQYAARVQQIYGSPSARQSLRVSSRDRFETHLNWDAWGKKMNKVLRSAVAARSAVVD